MSCPWEAHACSCVLIESFCQLVSQYLPSDDDDRMVVVRVRVVDKVPSRLHDSFSNDLMVEVLESYYNPRSITSIQIRSGNGADCGRSLDSYDVGDQLIFAEWIRTDTFATAQFSICSPEPLRVRKNRVEGRISEPRVQSVSLLEFRTLNNCTHALLRAGVYPNPAHHTLHIHLPPRQMNSRVEHIAIYDAIGRRVLQKNLTERDTSETIFSMDVSQWPAGVYLVSVPEGSVTRTSRIVIAR